MFSQQEKKPAAKAIEASLQAKNQISDILHEIADIRIINKQGDFGYPIFGIMYVEDYLEKDMSSLTKLRDCMDNIKIILAEPEDRDHVINKPEAEKLLVQLKNAYDTYIISLHKIRSGWEQTLEVTHAELLKHEQTAEPTPTFKSG